MLLLFAGYFSAAGAPSTPSGTGNIPVIAAQPVHTIKGEPTSTISGERINTVRNG